MSMLDQVLGPLEVAINRALGASPRSLEVMRSSDEPVALYFRDLGWGFRIAPTAHGVQLLAGIDSARAALSTSLVGLARLLAGEDPRAMGSALVMEGDAEYAERLLGALRSARIDLEGELSGLLGPLLGERLGQGLKGLLGFGRDSLRSLLLGGGGGADGQLADANEARAWMDGVDDAATALDRIEARIARLESRRDS